MKNIYNRLILVPLVFILLLASCTTPIQDLVYINGIKTGTTYESGPKPDEYKIRTDDQLFIQVISDDPTNVAIFNITNTQMGSANIGSTTNSMELITYLVDIDGMITFPQLGKLKVAGLTIDEVTSLIQKGIDQYLKGASVFVKMVNRSITVLGEVNQPGQKPMVKNQLTIFEAIGSAGGVNDWGNRKNIKVVRETSTGKLVAELNLTDPGVINSPYYYVLPHDVILVDPSKKVYGSKTMPYATPISLSLALVSTLVLVLNLFKP